MAKRPTPKPAPPVEDAFEAFEQGLVDAAEEAYVLRLFVSGMSPRSLRAIENTRKLCAEHLAGRFTLEIIDIYQQPIFAKEGQIVAAPTLIKELPAPLRRIIGDLSQTDRILAGLDIRRRG